MLLAFGRSIFLDIAPYRAAALPFFIGRFSAIFTVVDIQDILVLALVGGWLYAMRVRPRPRLRSLHGWRFFIACLAGFLALELALSVFDSGTFDAAAIAGTRVWFYIPLGFMLTVDTFRRFSKDEVLEFLGFVSWLTVFVMLVYSAAALGWSLYPYPKYLSLTIEGTLIVRDFTTFPFWTGLAIAYFLTLPRHGPKAVLALTLLALGCFFTYTRSYVLGAVFVTLVYIVLTAMIGHRGLRTIAYVVAAAAILVGLGVALALLAPTQLGYFQARMQEIGSPVKIATVGNVQFRTDQFARAYEAGADTSALFGAGLIDDVPAAIQARYLSYDSDWTYMVNRLGPVGLGFMALPLLVAVVACIRTIAGRSGLGASKQLGMLLLLMLVFAVMMRFFSILTLWWYPFGLWSVALVALNSSGAFVPSGAPSGDRGVSASRSRNARG